MKRLTIATTVVALVGAASAQAAGFPTPAFHATAHTTHNQVLFTGRFNLDPHGTCANYDYATANEPDLGEGDIGQSCAPDGFKVTVTVHLYNHQHRVFSRATHASVRNLKGGWVFAAPCQGTRWSATLLNPWGGTNTSVTGTINCKGTTK